MVYASQSRSLALLEILAHVERSAFPPDYEYFWLDVPDDATIDISDLPSGWDVSPPPSVTRKLGDAWVHGASSVALRVPSAIVDGEWNLLLNPAHPRFADIGRGSGGAVRLDPRLLT